MNLTETYRPSTLEEVLGQSHVVSSLQKSIGEKRHSTYLFEGPSGVGKTTIARICARMLGCEGFDLIEFDAASQSGVEEIRKILDLSNSFPLSGARVFIVDECQRLSKNAWDALLKTTEQPNPNNFWFFCTTEVSKVPKTIRTRSQEFKLRPVSSNEIASLLETVRDQECIAVTDETIERIASSVAGSPREAINRLAQMDGLAPEDIETIFSSEVGLPIAYDLARLLSDRDFSLKEAMSLLSQMKDESPEGIRQVVRAYYTTFVLRAPTHSWALSVLSEFERPAVEQNYITDIVMRIARIDKWRKK